MESKGAKKIDYRHNIKIYYNLLKKHKWILLVLLTLILLVEFTTLINSYLFKTVIDKGAEFSANTISKEVFSQALLAVAAIFIGVLIFATFGSWLEMHLTNSLEMSLITDLKRNFFNHLISLDHTFHTSHKTGSLISRLSRGGRAIERLSDILVFNFAPLIFQLITVIVSLVYLTVMGPAAIIVLTALAFISYNLFIQKYQLIANLEANQAEDIEKGNIADIFTNIDSVKYFGKDSSVKRKFMELTERTKNAFLRHWNYFRWTNSGQRLIVGIGTFFLVYVSINQYLKGEISLGTLTFVYSIYTGLLGSLFGFVHGLRSLYSAMADFQDLFEYAKIESKIKDKPESPNLKIKDGEIEFKNISFKYGNKEIFNNFSLRIPKNKKVAFVGHSGCGKTTLVKLLYRFYDVNQGNIFIDGKNIKNFKQESLRSEMSVVPQECILFDDTIYNNISFPKPSSSKEDVKRAIKFAQLDKFVNSLQNKDATIVGERGVKLSGGEKQRVSIARAILADKKVLILDEATSSLDSQTEFEIQNDLERLMEGRTSIIIAHRLSTIMRADMIVVMKNGKIVQKGTHNELIKQKGEYKHLWNLQKGGYIK